MFALSYLKRTATKDPILKQFSTWSGSLISKKSRKHAKMLQDLQTAANSKHTPLVQQIQIRCMLIFNKLRQIKCQKKENIENKTHEIGPGHSEIMKMIKRVVLNERVMQIYKRLKDCWFHEDLMLSFLYIHLHSFVLKVSDISQLEVSFHSSHSLLPSTSD